MIIRAWPRTVASANAPVLLAGGDDVRADVAESDEPAVLLERREAREPAARDVLEEDALDRLLRTEGEHLVEGGRRPTRTVGSISGAATPQR